MGAGSLREAGVEGAGGGISKGGGSREKWEKFPMQKCRCNQRSPSKSLEGGGLGGGGGGDMIDSVIE